MDNSQTMPPEYNDPDNDKRTSRPATSNYTLEPFTPSSLAGLMGETVMERRDFQMQEKYDKENHEKTDELSSKWTKVHHTRTRRQTKNSKYSSRLLDNNDENAKYYIKYFNIKFPGKNLETDIDIIQTDIDLHSHIGKPEKIVKAGYNSLHVATMSQQQSDKLINLKYLAGTSITVEPHRSLNTVKGIVRSKSFNNSTIEALEEKLKEHGVTQVRRITKKIGETIIPSDIYILHFNRQERPNSLKITDWHSVKVTEYKERPQQCYNCQKYGHVSKYCRKLTPTCSKCTQDGHTMKQCESQITKCYNCSEEHISSSKECKSYKMEEEILATMIREHIPKYHARQIVKERSPQYGKLYSDATKRQNINRIQQRTLDDGNTTNSLITSEIFAEVHHSNSSQVIEKKMTTMGKPKKTNKYKHASYDELDEIISTHRRTSMSEEIPKDSLKQTQESKPKKEKTSKHKLSNSLEKLSYYSNDSDSNESSTMDQTTTTKRKRNYSPTTLKSKIHKPTNTISKKNENFSWKIPVINR